MSSIINRYSSAIRSRDMSSRPTTTRSDSDVIAAAGLAGKREPFGMALLRLFVGDNHAAGEVVEILAKKAVGKAYRLGNKCGPVEADDIARAVLAWHRHGTCGHCGGHGVKIIPGTTTLGNDTCKPCAGAGRIQFDRQFSPARLDLARWLSAEIDKEQASAGPEALRMLAPRLDI